MKKILLILITIVSYFLSYSQPITQRSSDAITVMDGNLFAKNSFRPAVFSDTTAGTISLDSCGKMIFTYSDNSYWLRACNPKRWIKILKTGDVASSLANNGLSKNGDTIQFGQTISAVGNPAALNSSREIPLNGFNTVFTGTGNVGIGTNAPGTSKLNVVASGTNRAISASTGTGIGIFGSSSGNAIVGQSTGAFTGVQGSTTGAGIGVEGSAVSTGIGGRFYTTAQGGSSDEISLQLEKLPTGTGAANGNGLTVMFKSPLIGQATSFESGKIKNYFSNANSGSQQSSFEFHLVNNAVSARKMLIANTGQLTLDGYPALTAQTDSTNIKPLGYNTTTGVVQPMANWIGSGGGIIYLYSASAPTGADTAKFWIKTPLFCGVYDVYTYVTGLGWERYGWLSMDGVFSKRRPANFVIAGQSNAVGIGSGGDTSRFSGLIGYSSGTVFTNGADAPTQWLPVYIGISPFFQDKNNIAFQVAKRIKKNYDADIIRIIATYEGGTGLNRWITPGQHYLLDSLRNRLSRSGIDTIDVFLWHQGESGGVTNASAGGYVVDQQVLYDSLCSSLTIGFFRNYTTYIAGGLGTDTLENVVQNIGSPSGGQQALNFDGNLNTGWVPAWGLHTLDGTHFTGTSLDTMGYRYYTAVKELPHSYNNEKEKMQYNFDYAYDPWFASIPKLIPYSGGGIAFKDFTGTSFGYTLSGNPILVMNANDASVDIGNFNSMAFSKKRLNVEGNMILGGINNSAICAGHFNLTGTIQHTTIFGNYTAAYNLTNGVNFTSILGTDGFGNMTRIPDNSVAVGHRAGYSSTTAGSGDYQTWVGKSAGEGSSGFANTYLGAFAGSNANSTTCTGIGTGAGAVNTSAYTNSSALGWSALWDKSNQIVLGDSSSTAELRTGKWRWNISSALTPSNGQYYAWNASTSKYELTSPTVATTLYNGDGSISSARTVTLGSNNLTFDASSSGDLAFTLGSDANYDIFYRNSSGSFARLAAGTDGYVLTTHSTSSAPTWTQPNYESGTYTPTLTNGTNVAASTAYQCQYMRVGNVVTVSGRVDIDPTATGATTLEISLPIASAVPNDFECGGTAISGASDGLSGGIRANTTNDTAEITAAIGATASLGSSAWYFTFTYLIDNS